MKKIILLILSLSMLTLPLASCFGGQGDNGEPDGGTPAYPTDGSVYSSELIPAILRPASGVSAEEMAAYNSIESALYQLTGSSPKRLTDDAEKTGVEIAVGRTNRAASALAYQYVDASEYAEGGVCFCIAYKDGTLAVAAANLLSMTLAAEYLIENYFNSQELKVNESLFDVVEMPADEYGDAAMDAIVAAEDEKFAKRWESLAAVADAETVAAFQRLYEFYGSEVIYWFANLWDPEVGGFYYANSSRDYEGFLPDIESTRQALVFVRNSGMISYYDGDLDKAIPEWMQEKILAFVDSLADPDGYYYHPQWGKNIGTSRRGRDLDWAIDLIGIFGGEFKYPTAIDQMKGQGSGSSSHLTSPLGASAATAVSAVLPSASASTALDSPENLIAWLNTMNFKANSHDYGHAVASMTSQIKAKGYGELVYNYFINIMEEVQEELRDEAEAEARKNDPSITDAEVVEVRKAAENGLWQKEINYVSLSGLYKLGGMINTLGYDLPHEYAMAAVRSAVKAITLEDEPTILVHVFNNWAGLNTQLSNMRSANSRAKAAGLTEPHDMEAAYAIVRAEAPALIDATVRKLALFRKSDGSFSYYQKNSAPITQGTPVSLGLSEGDVNASMISLTSISNFMFSTMGYERVPMYSLRDFLGFMKVVENAPPVEKEKLDSGIDIDFEDGDVVPAGISDSSSSGALSVVADPTGQGKGNVLAFTSHAGVGDTFTVNVPGIANGVNMVAFEADYCIKDATDVNSIDDYQIQLKATNGNVYMYTFAYGSGDDVKIGDDSSTAAGNVNRFATVKKGEWFRLRIECYQLDDGSVRFKLILNGTTVGVSQNFYGSEGTGATPKFGLSSVLIRALQRTDATLLMDNLKTESAFGAEYNEK